MKGHVVFGVTGSIAAVKAPEIVRSLRERGLDVSCVVTDAAKKFVAPLALATFSGKPVVESLWGEDAYAMPHLKLAESANLLLIAPASASILGRCANGIADDMVSLLYLNTRAPVLMAPAMHPTMWTHPATQKNVQILKERGVRFAGPYKGLLADDTEGDGRMEEPARIVEHVESLLRERKGG